MSEIIKVGLDLAKCVFQTHGADGAGQPAKPARHRWQHTVIAHLSQNQRRDWQDR